jgi:hypothetical protein
MLNLGMRPYTQLLLQRRADRLAKEFPRYDAKMLMDYCHAVKLNDK